MTLEKQVTINASAKVFKKHLQNETYDNMILMDDEVLNDLYHINFGKLVLNVWKKHSAMTKILNAEF